MTPVEVHRGDGPVVLGLPHTGTHVPPEIESRLNARGLWTLYVKEVRRFLNVATQTLLAPMVTTLLFLAVFTLALGGQRLAADGTSYGAFLAPGLMVMAMIGGGMVPLMFLPGWLQDIASVSPVKWSILALEGAIWRDFSYAELAGPCGVLVGMGAVCFVVGTRAFRWSA